MGGKKERKTRKGSAACSRNERATMDKDQTCQIPKMGR